MLQINETKSQTFETKSQTFETLLFGGKQNRKLNQASSRGNEWSLIVETSEQLI